MVNFSQWSQGIAFSADTKAILVQNMAEKQIRVLRWDGRMPSDIGHRQDQREPGGDPHRHGLI